MPNLTVRADDDLLDALDTEADERDVSRAEYVRRILDSRHESDERVAALESELSECERECERLKREKRQILDQRDEHRDLVRAVEAEQSLAEKRARASAFQRFRWWLAGFDDDED